MIKVRNMNSLVLSLAMTKCYIVFCFISQLNSYTKSYYLSSWTVCYVYVWIVPYGCISEYNCLAQVLYINSHVKFTLYCGKWYINMGTSGLADILILSPQACGPCALGIHIRWAIRAHVTSTKCIYMRKLTEMHFTFL